MYDLYIRPGGAVTGEHIHPTIEERFTLQRGQVGFRINRPESMAKPGIPITVPPGVAHDWWNAGTDEAHVLVEVSPAARFEAMISNLFGLAQDGKTNARGRPNVLQAALFAREFADVLSFTRPPRWVQWLLFGALAPLARLVGYRGSYPEYQWRPRRRVAVNSWPATPTT